MGKKDEKEEVQIYKIDDDDKIKTIYEGHDKEFVIFLKFTTLQGKPVLNMGLDKFDMGNNSDSYTLNGNEYLAEARSVFKGKFSILLVF